MEIRRKIHINMKSRKTRTVLLIGALFLCFFLGLKYRDYRSYQIPIPQKASTLVKINVDKIYKTLAWDFLTHPSAFSKSSKEEAKKKGAGLEIPSNIVIYTIEGQKKTLFFGVLRVSDITEFKTFLKRQFQVSEFKNAKNRIQLTVSKNKQFRFAFTQNTVAFAVSLSKIKSKINPILKDLLKGKKHFPPTNNPLFETLKQAEGHISFVRNNGSGRLDFEEGKIKMHTIFSALKIKVPAKPSHKIFEDSSSVKVWINADLRGLIPSKPIKLGKNIFMNGDSLKKYIGNYMELEFSGNTLQMDTVIAYRYTENFEKIQVKKPVKKEVPMIRAFMETENHGIFKFLKRKNILSQDSKMNEAIFPLYQLYASKTKTGFYVGTSEYAGPKKNKKEFSENFFQLAVNFHRLRTQGTFPTLEKYFVDFDSLWITARKKSADQLELNAELFVTKKELNALFLLTF